MKMKMMLLALPPALGTTLLYAAEPQTGVINRDTLEAPLQAASVNPQGCWLEQRPAARLSRIVGGNGIDSLGS